MASNKAKKVLWTNRKKKNITKYIKHTTHLILQNFFIKSSSLDDVPAVNREKTGKKKKVNSPKRRFVL